MRGRMTTWHETYSAHGNTEPLPHPCTGSSHIWWTLSLLAAAAARAQSPTGEGDLNWKGRIRFTPINWCRLERGCFSVKKKRKKVWYLDHSIGCSPAGNQRWRWVGTLVKTHTFGLLDWILNRPSRLCARCPAHEGTLPRKIRCNINTIRSRYGQTMARGQCAAH